MRAAWLGRTPGSPRRVARRLHAGCSGGALKNDVPPNTNRVATWTLPDIPTVLDVLHWIVFRGVLPHAGLDDGIDIAIKWGYFPNQTLVALEARASATPYCIWEPLVLDGNSWDGGKYKDIASSPNGPRMIRRIVATMSARQGRVVSFREAADRLRSELAAIQRDSEMLKEAKRVLMAALSSGKIRAWGKRDLGRGAPNPAAGYEKIERGVFWDELVSVTEWGKVDANPDDLRAILNYRGPTFREVRFEAEDVRRLWPVHECSGATVVAAVASSAAARPDDAADAPAKAVQRPQQVNRGGRPAVWDWDAFNREVVRLANTINGLPPRAELQRHMLDWCEQTWGESPAESTVRERIARIYPEGE
jgi:hypothetical protein